MPGAKGSYVRIVDAVKAGRPAEAPYPAAYLSRPEAAASAPEAAATPAPEAPPASDAATPAGE